MLLLTAQKLPKEDLESKLADYVSKNHEGESSKMWIRKSGISVHFKTPIKGDPANGFVANRPHVW